MNPQNPHFVQPRGKPGVYRLTRAILRLGVRLFFPGLRLLNREKLERPGPAILIITHPRSLPVAILLVTSLNHQVHCLVPAKQVRSIFERLVGWALGMEVFESLAGPQESLLNSCLSVLTNQGIIALFDSPFQQHGGPRAPVADFAARLALEAVLPGPGQVEPGLYPVHWYLSAERRRPERLVYIEGPIQAHHFLPKVGEDAAEASLHLAETVQKAIGPNIFGLAEVELEHFRRELEDFSREHLELQWSRHTNWKQQPEELRLSSIATRWLAEQNCADPACLVELRASLDAYREERRRFSMRQFIVEFSGGWQASSVHVAAAWIETVLGLPVALYGLLNHFPAAIALSTTGFLKSSPKRDPKAEWLVRILVVLSFYTIQILLVHFWWGRAGAGYYALTLPVSGAYLWRYRWVWRHRTHVLLFKAQHSARWARLARRREKILDRFTRELERSLQSPGVSCGQSPESAE